MIKLTIISSIISKIWVVCGFCKSYNNYKPWYTKSVWIRPLTAELIKCVIATTLLSNSLEKGNILEWLSALFSKLNYLPTTEKR